MAFSVYEGGQHRVYATTRDEVLAGMPPQDLPAVSAALLPPATRRDGSFLALLENPLRGLPAQVPAETEPYKPRLQLDARRRSRPLASAAIASARSAAAAWPFS